MEQGFQYNLPADLFDGPMQVHINDINQFFASKNHKFLI